MGSEHYCLRWNNHQNNLLGVFSQLLRDESLVDVTLACSEGHSIRAHKVVLSACSSYFQTLFVDHPSRHPIVILKDVRFSELRTLVDFMYKGEVNVEYCQLSALLKTAESLKVKGLAEMTRDYKQEPGHIVEPPEFVRSSSRITHGPPSPEEHHDLINRGISERERDTSPAPQNLRLCKLLPTSTAPEHTDTSSELNRPSSTDNREISASSSTSNRNICSPLSNNDHGPADLVVHNSSSNNNASSISSPVVQQREQSAICSRLDSPINNEPVPGPSNLPPVQQVPLSLKKEADWGGGMDEKNIGESSSDYSRHPHDSGVLELECCFNSPYVDRPSSTQSSRSSTPFALPFSGLPASLLEISLIHPALLGEEMLRCTSCMAAFPSVWLLEQHIALQHLGSLNSVDKPFVCDQCGQSYRYRSAYVKHREQNHRARLPADKLFSCDVCGMQFRYLKSFKKHRLNHALEKLHGKNGAIINTKEGLKSGLENDCYKDTTHENSSDQVSSSNETIAAADNEVEPTVQVKQEPPNTDITGEGTSSDAEKEQDDAIDSMSFSYNDIPDHPTTRAAELLRNHQQTSLLNFLRNSSSETAERQRERRFACPFCGKCVRSKENLKLHVRKHTGERPFVCLFCGRAFGGKSDLTRHLRIHTGERPYHCDMCGKCFARADYLSKHLTTHINTPR